MLNTQIHSEWTTFRTGRPPTAPTLWNRGKGLFAILVLGILMAGNATALAATVSWIGTIGDWNTPANWSTGALPGATDDVTIDAGGSQTVTCASGAHNISSVQCQEDFVLSGGSLTIANATQFAASFSQSSGVLSGSGDVTLSGAFTWTSGMMGGTGRTIIPFAGTATLIGGGTKGLDGSRVFENRGTVTWTGGAIDLNAGSTGGSGRIENAAGGLFGIQTDNAISATGFADLNTPAPRLNNPGTLGKSAGAGTTTSRCLLSTRA